MMMKQPKRVWGRWVIGAGFVLLLALVVLSMAGVIKPSGPLGLIARAVAPLQKLAQGAVDGVRDWMNRRAYQEDLDLLYNELLEMYYQQRSENTQMLEIQQENQRLLALLGYAEENPTYTLMHARVIARDPSEWFSVLIIDRGAQHGLKAGMPVVTHEGLVGRILEAGDTTAQVLTVLDGRSAIPCTVSQTRDQGIAEGYYAADVGQPILLTKLPFDIPDLNPGYTVLTSGVDSFFPRGIVIGRISDVVHLGNRERQIAVQPAVDIHRLENVLIITEERASSSAAVPPSFTDSTPDPAGEGPQDETP